jgi:transcriptional regulator with XRE-family HTH domain
VNISSGAKRLHALIEKRDITQRVMADELGMSEAHLSQILSGARTPSLEMAAKIERQLRIPMRDFADTREVA